MYNLEHKAWKLHKKQEEKHVDAWALQRAEASRNEVKWNVLTKKVRNSIYFILKFDAILLSNDILT